jgi:hypothetical protein
MKHMRTSLSWLCFGLIILTISGCGRITGSGDLVTELRQVDRFDAIDAGGIVEVVFQQGPTSRVEVSADDNIISLVETKVRGNTLHLSLKKRNSLSDVTVRVMVTAPSLKRVECSGASTFLSKAVWQDEAGIRIEASGASQVETEVDARAVVVKASGAATVQLRGKTMSTNWDASGRASIRGFSLLAEDAKLDASGAASIEAYGSIRVQATASGAGSIRHTGGGAVVSKTSGAATVSPK